MNNKLNMHTQTRSYTETHTYRALFGLEIWSSHKPRRRSTHRWVWVDSWHFYLRSRAFVLPPIAFFFLFFLVCRTRLALQADALTMSRLSYHLRCTEQSWTAFVSHASIIPLAGIHIHARVRTHSQSVTMATPTLDAHPHTHTHAHTHRHRRQMGQWTKMYMLFDLLPIEAIMLVSCSGTARHERVWTVN